MIIRYLTQKDIAEHDKISSQAFSYSCDIHAPESVLPCEKVLGAFDDDDKTLFADFEIHEKMCNYEGGVLTCAAVGGVAAKPEHRGKGAVKALFEHLFCANNYDISILYPFSEPYYRKLGYERAGHSLCLTVPFSEVSFVKRNQDVQLYEGNETARLLEIYNRCARRYNLSFIRESADAFSADPYFSQKYTYIWKNDAFATLQIDREKSIVFVDEFYYDSCDAMLGMIGFLRNFESNQKRICFSKMPDDFHLVNFLQDLKNCEIQLHNTGSVKVLDFEKVLRLHPYPPQNGGFTLQICDDVYHVAYSEDGVETDKNRGYTPDVIMDGSMASKILLCGCSNASYMPNVVVQNPQSDFFTLFPPKTSFFTDAF